ncbi:PD-(D/E)XK motif protein [Persicimonas caeni]|uniref:PD-(D/E)XK motif protein n=1 Tax=Persicimonas caeni TaxID=2292766 RepID=A0A4Y6PUU3_PERCE|nr:PD-(D/E)XK motif protein [Persicimonas caeni]QDG52092.1 PD-(D/E)XK motif protein [Persicimonas caeni]QED33313.1 PD-(D/E)XK motif protein [Persicimonas caeni]
MKLEQLWNDIAAEIASDGLSLSDLQLLRSGARTTWGEIYVGVDPKGRRHVVVPAPDNASEELDNSSRGMRVEVKPYISDGKQRLYCDISCQLSELNDMFSVVAQDMIDELLAEEGASPFPVCVRVLERWRQLLERVPVTMLSPQKQAGLITELLLLNDLAELSPKAIKAWVGPDGGRHDFVSEAVDIEVKSSMRVEGRRVHVQSLDQLDISEGRLYLHFVALREPVGQGITIPGLVDQLKAKGVNSVDLHEKLAAVGYSPVDRAKYEETRFEVVERLTYRVDQPGFPRLVASSFSAQLPAGVERVNYDINLDVDGVEPITDEELQEALQALVTT